MIDILANFLACWEFEAMPRKSLHTNNNAKRKKILHTVPNISVKQQCPIMWHEERRVCKFGSFAGKGKNWSVKKLIS